MSDFNFVKEKKNTSFFPALECGITYSGNSLNGHRLLRTPAYNGQFHFSRRKAHKFSQIFALYGYQLIQSTDIFLCPESQTQVFFFYQASTRNDIWGINNGGSFLKIYSKIYNLKQWMKWGVIQFQSHLKTFARCTDVNNDVTAIKFLIVYLHKIIYFITESLVSVRSSHEQTYPST